MHHHSSIPFLSSLPPSTPSPFPLNLALILLIPAQFPANASLFPANASLFPANASLFPANAAQAPLDAPAPPQLRPRSSSSGPPTPRSILPTALRRSYANNSVGKAFATRSCCTEAGYAATQVARVKVFSIRAQQNTLGRVRVTLHKGVSFPRMDALGLCDPYCVLSLGYPQYQPGRSRYRVFRVVLWSGTEGRLVPTVAVSTVLCAMCYAPGGTDMSAVRCTAIAAAVLMRGYGATRQYKTSVKHNTFHPVLRHTATSLHLVWEEEFAIPVDFSEVSASEVAPYDTPWTLDPRSYTPHPTPYTIHLTHPTPYTSRLGSGYRG
eukprot:3298617-Rhodomonas_salina.1